MAFGRHRVRVADPHPCSLAAGVLLERKLRDLELDGWFTFRAQFLAAQKSMHGDLVCHYCGKTGLTEDIESLNGAGFGSLATIDHVIPRSKGGAEKDESNLVVACYPCNQRKKDKVLA